MKEGLDVEDGKVDLTIIVFVTLKGKEKEKEKLIHGLGNSCVYQTVMPKKHQHQWKNQVLQKGGLGVKM